MNIINLTDFRILNWILSQYLWNSIEYQTIFKNQNFVFPELLWPYTIVLVVANCYKSWVCDSSLESSALEQPEMLRSHNFNHKYHASKQCAPTVYHHNNHNYRRRGSVRECLNHPWIFPRIPNDILLRQSNEINMDNLRNYQARKRWKVCGQVLIIVF